MTGEIEPVAWVDRRHRVPEAGQDVGRGRAAVLRARWARSATANSGCRSMRRPCRLRVRLTGGCSSPEAWDEPDAFSQARRAGAHLPEDVHHRPKWQLALEMIDELRAWGLTAPVVLGDGAYGDVTDLRSGLTERGISYVLDVKAVTSAYPEPVVARDAERAPGRGRRRPRAIAPIRHRCAISRWRPASRPTVEIQWREGTRGPMRSRFLALRVRPANIELRKAAHAAGAELDVAWLIAQWPPGTGRADQILALQPARKTRHCASWSPWPSCAGASSRTTANSKTRLGLDHFEGPLLAWLASPRHPRLGRAWLPDHRTATPPANAGGRLISLHEIVRELQALLACWQGTCPTCRTRLPPDHPLHQPP